MEAQDNMRLTELQTRDLLEFVLAGVQSNFEQWGEEKFNSREFYEWIPEKVHSLRTMDWRLLRNQMRVLKVGYLKAAALQEEADNDVEHLLELDVADHINEICPFWDLLSEIYGSTPRTHKTETEDEYYDDIYNAVSAELFQNNSDSQPMDEDENDEEEEDEEEQQEQKEPFEEVIMTEEMEIAESSSPMKSRHSTYRWRDKETHKLLDAVLNVVKTQPKRFEQPSARRFYGKIFPEVHFRICKSKMRHLKATYKSAMEQASTGTDHLDGETFKTHLQRVCPFWAQLHRIFGMKMSSLKGDSQNNTPEETHIKIEPVLIIDDVHDDLCAEENETYRDEDEDIEGDELFEPTMPKRKHERPRVLHRWRNEEIVNLLRAILRRVKQNLEAFEKPTAQIFYENVFPAQSWGACKGKVRYLKESYISAVTFRRKNQTLDEDALNEGIQTICPYWELLHQIFGQRSNNRFSVGSRVDDEEHVEKPSNSNALHVACHKDNADSSHSEDSYPFENEDAVYNPNRPAKKRNYKNGMHRWQHNETQQLLKMVLREIQRDPLNFEKPTAQMFYEKVFPSQSFRSCQGRMRYLKRSYVSAVERRKQQVNLGVEEDTQKAAIRKICPYWDLLHQIHGQHSNSWDDAFFIGLSDHEQHVVAGNSTAQLKMTTSAIEDTQGDCVGNGSSNSKDAYPLKYNDESHNQNTDKNTRHRWNHSETKKLLQMIVNEIKQDPDNFEKPTARQFYIKVFPQQYWNSCKFRMRYLKTSYVAAVELREQQRSINLELDEDSLKEQVRKVCPYWDLLHQIHGQRLNAKDDKFCIGLSADEDNEDDGEEDEEEDNQKSCQNTDKNTRHRWNHSETKKLLQMIVNEIKQDPDVFEKPTARQFYTKVYPQRFWNLTKFRMRYLKTSYVAAVKLREQQRNINLELDEDTLKEQIRRMCPYWNLLHQIHGQRLNVKEDKLLTGLSADENDDDDGDEDEEEVNHLIKSISTSFVSSMPKKNANSKLSLKEDVLRLERDKVVNDLEMRKLELQHQFDLKRLELERDERLALARLKLEVESQERLKKYELDLKLRNNSKTF